MTALAVSAWVLGLIGAVWLLESPGWLPCDRRDWPHEDHLWAYRDPSTGEVTRVHCNGVDRAEEEPPCGCSDPLCACSPRPAGWSTHRAHGMNGEGL